MKSSFSILLALSLALCGCTVRGGWPRFLRHGESPGWNGPKPDNASGKTKTWSESSDYDRRNGFFHPDEAFYHSEQYTNDLEQSADTIIRLKQQRTK